MAVSVAAVMRQINNFFEVGHIDGVFAISGNAIVPAAESAWCCIRGSMLHDGVWQVCGGRLQDMPGLLPDEEFDGRVWLLSPPPDFVSLCEEISAYDDKNPVGAYASESFGGYSYKRNVAGGRNGSATWQTAFSDRLTPYRRMFTEVM